NEIKHYLKTGTQLPSPDMTERVRIVRQHLDFSIRWKGDKLGIFEMRRHYTNYFRGTADFKPFRTRLVEADTHAEVNQILSEVVKTYAEATEVLIA
ncbi:MAG TPA: tRNA-dihydrouridine synthase, partial [Cyclobacteriaceae bacterium]|nr:tRNA-dihydrouridine synthase [Cyclobacteriaceae bacterium]